jgi:hypothetical protein
MGDSFLKTVVQTLREMGVGFTLRKSDQPVASGGSQGGSFARNGKPPERAIYRGYFGRTCPDCETPAGKKHRKECIWYPKRKEVEDSIPGAD